MSDRRGQDEIPASASTDTAAPTAGGPTIIDVTPIAEAHASQSETPKRGAARELALALAVVVGALATSPYWAPPIASVLPWGSPPPAPVVVPASAPVDLAPLEARFTALETRIAELSQALQRVAGLEPRLAQAEQRLASAGPSPRDAQLAAQQAQALGSLGDRLGALEQRVAAFPSAKANDASAEAIKTLQSELQAVGQKQAEQAQLLAKLQRAEASGDGGGLALLITLSQLRAVLATSRPYMAELHATEALSRDHPETLAELQKLDARAEQGVPNLATLTERFDSVAASVLRASARATAGESWDARALAKLKGLITVRRVGERAAATAPGADGALAAAGAALKSGDLAGAVAAMKRLPAGPAAVATWLADAGARLDVETTEAAIDAALLRDLRADTISGPKP